MECYWFSIDRTRWSRMTHALRMGREYTEPFQGFGKGDKHEISSLCEHQDEPLLEVSHASSLSMRCLLLLLGRLSKGFVLL